MKSVKMSGIISQYIVQGKASKDRDAIKCHGDTDEVRWNQKSLGKQLRRKELRTGYRRNDLC